MIIFKSRDTRALELSSSPRNRNRVNRNPSWNFGLRIGLFCELGTKVRSKETYENRNSRAWLRNAGSYFGVSYRSAERANRPFPLLLLIRDLV